MPDVPTATSKTFLNNLEAAVRYPSSSEANVSSWITLRRSLTGDPYISNENVLAYIHRIKRHCDAQIAYWKTIQAFATIARIRPAFYSNEYDDP